MLLNPRKDDGEFMWEEAPRELREMLKPSYHLKKKGGINRREDLQRVKNGGFRILGE